jgi:(2Fe-2S) ferredoxin
MSSSSEFASITSSESDLITVDLANKVQTLGLNQIERHIFICADQTNPLCCSKEQSLEAWDYLKKRLTELKLDQVTEGKPSCTFRTKANCLRVCTHGPILVVYPDGVWYHSATSEVIERILQEHILGSQVVQEYVFLTPPLTHPLQITNDKLLNS